MLWALAILIAAGIGETYFFLLQRSALQVCRAGDLPTRMRFQMLPRYYRAGWLFIIAKWLAAGILVFQGHWLVALIGILVFFLFSMLIPVPHEAFFELFYRELEEKRKNVDPLNQMVLKRALEAVDEKFKITHRFHGTKYEGP